MFQADVLFIKNLRKEFQCRIEKISILHDPISQARSVLYFRTIKDEERFEEWPGRFVLLDAAKSADPGNQVTIFKEPSRPSVRSKSITIESVGGRCLSISKENNLSRKNTQMSTTTIASLDSEQRTNSKLEKGIKGLIIEFHDTASQCSGFPDKFHCNIC